MQRRFKKAAGNGIWLAVVLIVLLLVFFPIYWMVVSSLRNNIELFRFPPGLWPETLTFGAYEAVFSDDVFLQAVFNTVFVAGITTLFAIGVASAGAYGMSRYRFRGRNFLQYYILATQMLPVVLLTLPFFAVYSQIGLYNTRIGLIIAYISFTVPFCTLTLIGFIGSIPRSLDEAAWIDGCTPLSTFLKIILPMSRTGLVATGVFAFVNAWNEYLMAVVLTSSSRARMLVVHIGSKITQYDIAWNELMAITVIASLPLVVLYGLVQKSFVKGITAGAIKM